MKRTRIVGLALVAVFALSAIGVSAASAMFEKAEFIKAGTKNGFTGKLKAGIVPTLAAPGSTVTCTGETSKGTINGNKSMGVSGVVVTFTGCKGHKGETNCNVKSKGAAGAEEVVTNVLSGTLARVLTKEATSEVGEVLEGPKEEFVTIEGSCLLLSPAPIKGRLGGEITPLNNSSLKGENVFLASGTSQKIKKACLLAPAGGFGGLPCQGNENGLDALKLSAFGFEASQATTEEITFEEATEVHTS